jgi:hypothetical protein
MWGLALARRRVAPSGGAGAREETPMTDRPLTDPMRRYLVALYTGAPLREFTIRYSTMRTALVKRGLIFKDGRKYELTEDGRLEAAKLVRMCGVCGGKGYREPMMADMTTWKCDRCGGSGLEAA